jgi:hypothetical protein
MRMQCSACGSDDCSVWWRRGIDLHSPRTSPAAWQTVREKKAEVCGHSTTLIFRGGPTAELQPSLPMREFEIYLPTTQNDGSKIDPRKLAAIRETLLISFGGYTETKFEGKGAWKMGGVTYRDEISIIKVLAAATADFDFAAFKRRVESDLEQEAVLIVDREVRIV